MATAAEITAITSLSSSADTAAGAGAGADFVTLTAGESAGLLLFFSLFPIPEKTFPNNDTTPHNNCKEHPASSTSIISTWTMARERASSMSV